MFHDSEVESIKKRNYRKIREVIRVSFGLGVNLTSPSSLKDWLKILHVFVIVSSSLSLYGQWNYIVHYSEDLTKIAECVSTFLQVIISIIKLSYYPLIQHKLYELLYKVQTYDFFRKCEIFQKDFPTNKTLTMKIDKIMEDNWKDLRRQCIFFIINCSSIIGSYFVVALFVNLYHDVKDTPDYQHILPFPAFYPIWEDKGMSFPYYQIQMFLSSCGAYIAGLGAMSFDGVFIILSVHSVGLIKVLNVMIESSTSADVPKERRVEYLRYCIFQYKRIYDFVDTVDSIYKHISLPQFILSLIVWGFLLFEISFGLASDKTTLFRNILFTVGAAYEIVLYCYNGQRVTSECEKIPMAFYSCEWYNESKEFKTFLHMMLIRTNRIFTMKVSWFTFMTLPTLMAMVKTSGSYFLLLQNLAE